MNNKKMVVILIILFNIIFRHYDKELLRIKI
jgi:hypothetical protein